MRLLGMAIAPFASPSLRRGSEVFLTRRQLRTLTGIPSTEPQEQLAELNRRGIRHLGINAAGRLIVPCSAIETPSKPLERSWTPDFTMMAK